MALVNADIAFEFGGDKKSTRNRRVKMVTVQREVTELLSRALSSRDALHLEEAFSKLKNLGESGVVVDEGRMSDVSSDLYLFCCEVALKFENWAVAKHCRDRFLEGSTTTKAYQIRALYARGVIDSHDAEGLRGGELVEAIQAALGKTLRGLKLALADPGRYAYLVVAGAQHAWNVARALYKHGSYGEIANAIGVVVAALDKIDFPDMQARVVWMLRHATALSGAARHAEANTVMTKAADVAAKSVPSLKYPIFRMQVALSKNTANPKLKQDAAKGTLRGIFAVQALFCGLVEGATAEAEVVGAYTDLHDEIVDQAPVVEKGKDAQKTPQPPPKKGGGPTAATPNASDVTDESGLRDETFAEVGFALALLEIADKAQVACAKSLHSKRLRSRVFAEYTQALLQAQACGGMKVQKERHANPMSDYMVQELASAVRRVERTLESAIRINDTVDRNYIVQTGCVLMWNIALPLLQCSTRGMISRCLQAAAKHLDDIESNMASLRTLLHHEVAQCDMDADYLSKSVTRVEKALSIDYVPNSEDVKLYALDRPLDRFLVWMQRRLNIKSNLYAKPDNPEDEALLILEQARDAPLMSKLSMLTRATNILQESEPPASYYVEESAALPLNGEAAAGQRHPAQAKPNPKKTKAPTGDLEDTKTIDPLIEKKRTHLRTRAQLWNMVMTYAWAEKSPLQIATVRGAAKCLLARSWPRKGDRDMRILQADAHLKMADVEVVELASKKLRVAQRKFFEEEEEEADEDDEEPDENAPEKEGVSALDAETMKAVAEKSAAVQAAELSMQQHLCSAAQIGAELCAQGWDEQWLVMNAAISLWNYYVGAFADNDFIAPAQGLATMYDHLIALQVDPKKETTLIGDIASAHVNSLLQQYMKEKVGADDTLAGVLKVLSADINSFRTTDASNAKLQRANDVCEKMIGLLPTPMDSQRFCALSVVVRRLQSKPPDARALSQHKVLTTISQVMQPISVEDKRNALTQVVEVLALDPNMELCAKVAELCTSTPGCERAGVRVCKIAQTLYEQGLLGISQKEDPSVVPQTAGKGTKEKDAKGKKTAQGDPVADTPPVPPAEPPPPTPTHWMWYSLALQYQAVLTAQLINPAMQDKPTQYEIRRQALISLTNSACAALRGPKEFCASFVFKTLRHFYFYCQEFAAEPATRALMFDSLKILLSETVLSRISISNKRNKEHREGDADIVVFLFVSLLHCLRDRNMINEGLEAMKLAVKVLPASHHKPLWDIDVQLRCQAGLSTNQTLLRVKEYGPETQARVWITLGRYSTDPRDQLFAFQSAVDLLEGKDVAKAECMLIMAQWMLQSNYEISIDDYRLLVLSVIDLVSQRVDVEAEEETITDAVTSIGGKSQQHLYRVESAGRASNASAEHKSSALRSIGSSSKVKRSRAGRVPVKQFLLLVQAYYLLAKVGCHSAACDGSPVDTRSTLCMAVHYLLRMLTATLAATNAQIMKDKLKKERAEARDAVLSQTAAHTATTTVQPISSEKDKKSNKEKPSKGSVAQPAVAERSRPATPAKEVFEPMVIPGSLEGWIGFSLPSNLPKRLRAMQGPWALTPEAVESPDCLLAVLTDLIEMLLREDLDLQVLPVLAVMQIVSDVFFGDGATHSAGRNMIMLQSYEFALSHGMGGLSVAFSVGNVYPVLAERTALLEDAKMSALQASKKRECAVPSSGSPHVSVVPVEKRYTHRLWIHICETMLAQGRISSAKQLLADTAVHAASYGDAETTSRCAFAVARIESLEGAHTKALESLSHAFASPDGDGRAPVGKHEAL